MITGTMNEDQGPLTTTRGHKRRWRATSDHRELQMTMEGQKCGYWGALATTP